MHMLVSVCLCLCIEAKCHYWITSAVTLYLAFGDQVSHGILSSLILLDCLGNTGRTFLSPLVNAE